MYYTGVDKNNAVKLSKGQTAKMIYKKLDVVTGDSNFTDGLIFNKSKHEGMSLLEHSLSSLRNIIDAKMKEFTSSGNRYQLNTEDIDFTYISNDGDFELPVKYNISVKIPNDHSHENAEFLLTIKKDEYSAVIPLKMNKIVKNFSIKRAE